jgi:hypothetical protein
MRWTAVPIVLKPQLKVDGDRPVSAPLLNGTGNHLVGCAVTGAGFPCGVADDSLALFNAPLIWLAEVGGVNDPARASCR